MSFCCRFKRFYPSFLGYCCLMVPNDIISHFNRLFTCTPPFIVLVIFFLVNITSFSLSPGRNTSSWQYPCHRSCLNGKPACRRKTVPLPYALAPCLCPFDFLLQFLKVSYLFHAFVAILLFPFCRMLNGRRGILGIRGCTSEGKSKKEGTCKKQNYSFQD